MKDKLKAQTVTISAMEAKFDIETDDPVTDDAGDSFVGSKEKRKSNKRNTKSFFIRIMLGISFIGFPLLFATTK